MSIRSSMIAGQVLAIDVGGTRIKVARIARDGTVLEVRKVPTPGHAAQPDSLALLRSLVRSETSARTYAAVGVVVPGRVDEEHGIVREASNLGWSDIELGTLLQSDANCRVVIGHDVRAAGLAEARAGVGMSLSSLAFVSIGTGLAAAIIIGGKIWKGAHDQAGELGHFVVRPDGDRCPCGRQGCVETVGTAAAVSRRYASVTGEYLGAEVVLERAGRGDMRARTIWHDAVGAIADAIVALNAAMDPERVVIGGGLSMAGLRLFEPLTDACMRRGAPAELEIVGSAFGDSGGWRGAAILAWDRIGQSRWEPGWRS